MTPLVSNMTDNLVYLVTGGCGFLGLHIVELLTKEDYVSEVRIFDVVEYEDAKAFATESTKVTFIKGSITEYSQLLEAMNGVHVVIHAAALLDYLDLGPFSKMIAVNVGGTENIIAACCTRNIPYLVYTSSVCAVGPNAKLEPMLRGTEDTEYSGEPQLPYGRTKAMAEKRVLKANGEQLSNGRRLFTCVLRPSHIFGEKQDLLEKEYLSAKANHGHIDYIEPEAVENNYTYVGNVAWMHVLAARQLLLKPEVLGGQIYYTYDDTPFSRLCMLRCAIFSEVDSTIQLGKLIPYWKMLALIYIHRVIKFILKPFWSLGPFLTIQTLNLNFTSFSYETDKAFRHFGYKPIYTWAETKSRVAQWVKCIKDT